MGRLPVLKPRQVVALLEAHGFTEVRQRGSHKQSRHPDGRTTTVPFHAGVGGQVIVSLCVRRNVSVSGRLLSALVPRRSCSQDPGVSSRSSTPGR
jgi:predicted RNA binding protein YcfA (HicA-like mRNA interferase family)